MPQGVGKLWDYLDDAISAEDREQVRAHVLLCRACRGELGFAEGLRELLASEEEAEIPSGVKARLERFVEDLWAVLRRPRLLARFGGDRGSDWTTR